jgi:hypothetical protein
MKAIITLFLISLSIPAFAQDKNTGAIAGKITDVKTAETIPMATIELIQTGSKIKSDLDGYYKFENLPAGKYSINVVYTGYPSTTINGIEVVKNTVTTFDVALSDTMATKAIDGEVVIVAPKSRESLTDMYLKQKNAPNFSDGIPADVIKRSPDKTAGDALKRISGASIQDNKFAIIRGLNDRYNAAYLNGGPLPSSESDRKAFSFDIFPANMLDNIVISKTATPDQPAEFAGGIISINTKSIPEKKFYSLSIGSGYNTITTFKQQQTYEGGKTDWLGLDDGTRQMPKEIPSVADYPTNINDQAALAKTFTTNWDLQEKTFSPNYNLQYAMGFSPKVKGRELGIISSITYSRTFNYNETTRKSFANSLNPDVPSQLENNFLDKNNSEQVLAGALLNLTYSLNENNRLSFKNIYSINSDDRLINRTGEREVLDANPTLIRSNARWFTSNNIFSSQLSGEHLLKKSKIRIDWIVSYSNVKRTIPNLRRSSYSRYKFVNDPNDPNPLDTVYAASIATSTVGPSYGGGMFFSDNNENSSSARLNVTYPMMLFKKIKSEFKTGLMAQLRQRDFNARQLGYTSFDIPGGSVTFDQSLLFLPEDEIFAAENMGLLQPASGGSNGVGGFKLYDGTKSTDSYKASSALSAGYLMLDNRFQLKNSLKSEMRFVWGVRAEYFNQILTAVKDDNSDLEINTKKLDILPSLNYIFSITKRQNVRFSYSQTLNRPEYRELAPFAFFDFATNLVTSGNDSLLRANIQNLDLRYEYFPGRGQILSGTLFYKHFTNPIEQISRADVSNEVTYRNVPTAQNYGIELEARSLLSALFHADTNSFFEQLTVYTNISIIRSSVDVSGVLGSGSESRPLQGQSPYVFNAGIYYNNVKYNWNATLSVNRVGPRIAIVGNLNEPDLWENSRTFLDFQVAKSFWDNRAEFKLNVANILAQKQIFYQNNGTNEDIKGLNGLFNTIFVGDRENRTGLDDTKDDAVWSTVFGRVFSASLSIRF